ncbi:MAG TPA: hypothetical protein VGM67_16455 [Gemmatimonadaceae bacterium]
MILATALAILGVPLILAAQDGGQRLVLEQGVPCRVEPDWAARVVRSYKLGQIIYIERDTLRGTSKWSSTETTLESGSHPPCWIEQPLTVTLEREHVDSAVLALTGHALQANRHPSFEELVAVENLLITTYAPWVQQSGLLQYRRLLVVEKASEARDNGSDKPLEVAWLVSHATFLAQDPFASGYYPLSKPYWDLFDRYPTAAWADELAWHAAQLPIPTDECYSDCVLKFHLIDGPMQYWRRLPHGNAIAAAIADGIKAAAYADTLACYDRKEHPGYPTDSPVPPAMVREIRSSLAAVTISSKKQLLDLLADAEAKCR